MSILRKPYEISVWEDEWDASSDKFIEKKICVIGSDKMQSQSRVIEPSFTQNVNGVKKLSFKLYKKYIDNITGQETDNVFAQFLINERKVKLKYGTYIDENGRTKERWYDFIIKNVDQTSSNYLYSYQLEDALVQELSKNGYDITLDSEIQNDLGTAAELGNRVLAGTDWTAESEKIVQKVEEALVYLTTTQSLFAHKILDQTSFAAGVDPEEKTTEIPSGSTILAFYSSCVDMPPRFQFIYVDGEITRDDKRVITNENCQYFIDCEDPKQFYSKQENGFNLPEGLSVAKVEEVYEDETKTTVTISGRYRGARYGFAHQAKYIPLLDRYVNLYNGPKYNTHNRDEEGKLIQSTLYYGYEDVKYISPAIVQNLVSSADFSSTSGWTAAKTKKTDNKPTIETVYGRFEGGTFKTCIEDIRAGIFEKEEIQSQYKSYLKMSFPKGEEGVIINSGPFDKRTTIGNLSKGDKLAMRYDCYRIMPTSKQRADLDISIGEYVYNTSAEAYIEKENSQLKFSSFEKNGDYYYSEMVGEGYSEKEFKEDSKLKICIKSALAGTYYLEKLEVFQATFNKQNTLIVPDSQAAELVEGTIERKYSYFKPYKVEMVTKAEDLKPDEITHTLTYGKYKPIYNEGAEKIRTVSAKESNYFNILQSIAETFECWLVLDIEREDDGAIIAKKVKFKNYAGGNNYAGFKYGINLKDIQRTYESKNIVTKLIVKQNNNEHGEDGFCTIARAGANGWGDTSIYDFQYYFSQGLLNESNYNILYSEESSEGLNGYFPRLKELNRNIIDKNKEIINVASDLTTYKAKYEVAKAGLEAAEKSIEDVRKRFKEQFNTEMDGFNDDILEITATIKGDSQNIILIEKSKVTPSKSSKSKKWSISGTFMRDTASGGAEGTATIELTQKFLTDEIKKEVIVNYSFNDGLKFTGAYAEFVPDKLDLSSTESLFIEASEYYEAERKHKADYESNKAKIETKQKEYDKLYEDISELQTQKEALNKLFFTRYSRFIQEGTWMDEKYYDDNLYYADALSVMYNSCYPQVAYNINVLALSCVPGYELFEFNPGDKTYAEDPEFFGNDKREEVIISELTENLDDPSKNSIRVQNFKNQFQDLFQRITATVQQAQYSTGAYEKAVALAEAEPQEKSSFLTTALDSMDTVLQAAGQQSVTWGNDGITIRRVESPSDAIRMVGGAILLSKQDDNGEQKWTTGMTTEGISASLITAGTINTSTIGIMSSEGPTFRWDAYGISAYDFATDKDNNITDINTNKFVRFDKFGLYGIEGKEGNGWHASKMEDIEENANFYLTWKGLRVGGFNIGKILPAGAKDSVMTFHYGLGYDEEGKQYYPQEILEDITDAEGNITQPKGSSFIICPSGFEVKQFEAKIEEEPFVDKKIKEEYLIDKKWNLLIGQKFGVSTKGEMYSISGNIAGFNIGKISPNGTNSNTAKLALHHGLYEGTDGSFNYAEANDAEGTPASLLLCPEGFYVTAHRDPYVDAGRSNRLWSILVGGSFGVSTKGELFATAGKIGDLFVERFSLDGEPIEVNGLDTRPFVLHGGFGKNGSAYELTDNSISIAFSSLGKGAYGIYGPSGHLWAQGTESSTLTKAWIMLIGRRFGVSTNGELRVLDPFLAFEKESNRILISQSGFSENTPNGKTEKSISWEEFFKLDKASEMLDRISMAPKPSNGDDPETYDLDNIKSTANSAYGLSSQNYWVLEDESKGLKPRTSTLEANYTALAARVAALEKELGISTDSNNTNDTEGNESNSGDGGNSQPGSGNGDDVTQEQI